MPDIGAITAVQGRIAAVAVPPARVVQLQERFDTLLARAVTASAADASPESAASVGSDEPPAGAFMSGASFLDGPGPAVPALASPVAGAGTSAPAAAWTAAPVLAAPRIIALPSATNVPTTGGSTLRVPGGPIPATTPRGTWVERVPIQRGKELAPYIQGVADRYGLDPALLAAVFWTESGYQADAVSSAGAVGLGQLMPGTAQTLGVNAWDPMQNMDGSARLYRYLIDKYGGNLELAISAYACGEGAVARAGGIPSDFARSYITKLLGRRDYLNGLRPGAP